MSLVRIFFPSCLNAFVRITKIRKKESSKDQVVISRRMCAQHVGGSDPLDDMLAIQCRTPGGLMGVPRKG